jgi:hypothetical protein
MNRPDRAGFFIFHARWRFFAAFHMSQGKHPVIDKYKTPGESGFF